MCMDILQVKGSKVGRTAKAIIDIPPLIRLLTTFLLTIIFVSENIK